MCNTCLLVILIRFQWSVGLYKDFDSIFLEICIVFWQLKSQCVISNPIQQSFKLEKGQFAFWYLTLICLLNQQRNLCKSSSAVMICDSLSNWVIYFIWYTTASVPPLPEKLYFIISCPNLFYQFSLSSPLLSFLLSPPLAVSFNYKADGSSSRTEREQGGNEVCSPVSEI